MEKIEYLDHGYVIFDPSSVSVLECLTSETALQKYVTDLAAISRGKDKSNNPKLRFNGLLKECSPSGPIGKLKLDVDPVTPRGSRPLEFVPITLRVRVYSYIKDGVSSKTYNVYNLYEEYVAEVTSSQFYNELIRHGHVIWCGRNNGHEEFIIQTNLRTIVNIGIDYKSFLGSKYGRYRDQKYMILKIKAPMFVWAQIMTHTQLSKESQSDRVTDTEKDYYLPKELHTNLAKNEEILEKYREYLQDIDLDTEELTEEDRSKLIDFLLNVLPAGECKQFFKDLGFKKEIYNRAMYYLQYKEFVIGGNIDIEGGVDGWTNLIKERVHIETSEGKVIHKHWTQKETSELCEIIYRLYDSNFIYPFIKNMRK